MAILDFILAGLWGLRISVLGLARAVFVILNVFDRPRPSS
jgi:hypothetical protein